MDPADKDLLILRRPELVEDIDIINGLLTHLLSRKVLNKRMVQSITYNNPPDRQVEELLDLLPKRGPNAFQLFCDALIATDQADVVTKHLQKGDDIQTSSATAVAETNIPSSPLPVSVAETTEVSLPTPVPTASPLLASASTSALSSLPSSIQASISPQSDPSAGQSSSLPTTPQKRPVKCSWEDDREKKSRLASPSETDSSPLKRIRSDSVICIRGENDNVIKIYSPEKGGHTREKDVFSFVNPSGSAASPKLIPQSEKTRNQGASRAEEVRYVMKHFIATDSEEDKGQEENLRLASSMLSNLPEEYLKLISASRVPTTKLRREGDFGSDLMRERLSRCDSTDTMETRKPEGLRLDVSRKPEMDQPDRVGETARVATSGVTLHLQPTLKPTPKPTDSTDGPLCVQVDQSTRQFYNLNRDKSYRMVGMPRGQALIINVNEVSEKPPRRGTDIDRDNLNNLLTQLHFQVTTYNDDDDLTALGMAEKLRSFAAKPEHATADACIICLLSHGEEGYMFGTDGKKIPLEEIFMLFDNRHCPTLLNKPKIFFIQACRGGMLDHGVKIVHDETDGGPQMPNNMVQHPSMSDMLICYPTLQGYYAWRNRERGSWYIEAVVRVFMKHAKCEDICAMLNRVNSDVSRKVSRTPQSEMDRMSQMSEYKSSLRQPYLFFYPGIGAPSI
ncbi:caspase-8-like [Littorina saxatilis]|uniref:caspase-8-like n=1 Tax=Littorina saxatilis TaxID=31220 RepID=UPI0038B5F730